MLMKNKYGNAIVVVNEKEVETFKSKGYTELKEEKPKTKKVEKTEEKKDN